ncbi:MAG: acyl-CoA carboxylase subunit beta [Flavobacteriales bacterium]|nr:acyl-CoA carboxylase subunit beta [Flavobacteriales bacterium]
MQTIQSKINTNTQVFKDNREGMLKLLEKLDGHLEESRFQGQEKHIAKARSEGKMLARERLDLVLDQDSPFLELLPLAGLGGKGFGTGGTTVGGIGIVCGRLVMIVSNVGTNKSGSIDFPTLQKAMRLNEIAEENELPSISLVESSGANLPDQAKIFNLGGTNFRDITRRSKKGIPSISVVFGNSTAGGAYIPGMSDYSIFVKDQAKVFLAGPPLVKMATNEVVDDETLGGAKMHSTISGVSDFLAEDELDGIRIARDLIATLKPAKTHFQPEGLADEPVYDKEELLGIVPPDVKIPFDIRDVIARTVDGSKFTEFKPDYGETLICGWANIHGYPVGIIANNGVLFSESANKGTHFIQLCNKNDVPLLFFQNITGFMVGKDYEQGGIIKHGAKLINAVSNSEVPAITIMMGASYGAGNYAMMGRAYQPRFLFSYPNARIAVMGPEQLAGVMEIIQRQAVQKAGGEYDEVQGKMLRDHMVNEAVKQSDAWYSSGQIWDDGVIDPRDTRNYLGMCLAIVNNAPIKGTDSYGIFRM